MLNMMILKIDKMIGTQWTMTEEQYCDWKTFGIDYLRKSLKLNKLSAEREMNWFGLMYGLKFDNPEFKLNC